MDASRQPERFARCAKALGISSLRNASRSRKLTGAERYGADQWPADALWLRTIRSPHAKARFEIGDLAPLFARHPGLVDAITARDVPVNGFGIFPDVKDQPVLADGRVRFRGEAVLCLVGEQRAVSAIAEAEVPIRWSPETPQTEIDDALASVADPLHAANPDNVLIRGRVVKGDVDAALAAAAFVACAAGAFAGPTYTIYATREGLVGGTTANGHVITNNSRYGTARFAYDGPDGEAWRISIVGFLLSLVTFGIYYPWYAAQLARFRAAHTTIQGARGRLTLNAYGEAGGIDGAAAFSG